MKIDLKVFRINQNIRIGAICVLIFIILLVSFALFKAITHRGVNEIKITHYKYNHNISANYKVNLKPNILYGPISLEEDQTYIANFIDNISTQFSYNYTGENKAQIIGDYEVVAVIEGYTGEKETYRSIWKKEFQLFPKTKFKVQDSKLLIYKDIPFKYQVYNNFVNSVNNSSGLNTEAKAEAFMNINIKIYTDKGLIEDKLSPSIVIPLKTNYFSIQKKQAGVKPGAIEGTKTTQLPISIKSIVIYSLIILLSIVVLLYIIFYTKAILVTDPLVKSLNSIFKEHGNRLVALKDDFIKESREIINVRSIDDLVRVADEISKPIMYKFSSNYHEIKEFYVIDEDCIFVVNVTNLQLMEENLGISNRIKGTTF